MPSVRLPSGPEHGAGTPLSRRVVLASAAVLTAGVVPGCTTQVTEPPRRERPRSSGTPSGDPDIALASTVLADEEAMLRLVLATARRHPRLAGPLAGARAVHRAHVDLLSRAVPKGAATTSPASPGRPLTPRVHPVPKAPRRALEALARAEDHLGIRGRRSAVAAESGAFARLLASMAAAAEQQAVYLAGAANDRR